MPMASKIPRIFCVGFLLGWSACGRIQKMDAPIRLENELHATTLRIRGFDPAMAMDKSSALAVGKIFEGLLQYSYWDRPYHVEPLLAAAMPDISEDGLVYRFQIRPGIYFSDDPCFTATDGKGRELTADDFVYSIKRVADIKTGSGGFWVFRGKIEGLDEFRAASEAETSTDYHLPVSGLRALDSHTLEIRLTQPYPQLLWVLTMPYAYAVASEAVDYYGANMVNHPVGTGPYILESARQNYQYTFAQNPQWRATGRMEVMPLNAPTPDAGKFLPLTPRIVEWVVGDPSTAWLLFLSGDLDLSEIRRDNWDRLITPDGTLSAELAARGIQLERASRMVVGYLAFNMDDPVVGKNRALRQALTSAFNTPTWISFQNNRVERPNGPIPPGVFGHSSSPERFPFDLDQAKKCLQEAGYPNGQDPATGRRLALTLETGQADDPEARQAAELIVHFMEQAGVSVQLQHQNWPAFLERLERRQAQMFIMSWVGDYPDAQNFLQLFYSPNASPGPNRSNYRNPEFDRIYEKLTDGQLSESEYVDLCEQATDILVEDCPWIFTSFPITYLLRQPWLKNYRYHDFPYGMEKYYAIQTE